MNLEKISNKDGFKVIPIINTHVFIFVGPPSSGKTYFAKSMYNAMVIDDIHHGKDFVVTRALSEFKEAYQRDPGVILILITNHPGLVDSIRADVDFVFGLGKHKKCGGVCDCASGVCSR